jgi:pimeloyl-ACP methyl ester carboxylesterase
VQRQKASTPHGEETMSDSNGVQLSVGSAWAREKCFAKVLGRRMAYIERGVGHPIVFLHGNPTSSFLWRGVLPHVEDSSRRLIAPDLIGMGDSDKIPAGAEPDRYRFARHARYVDAFVDEVVGTEPLTLVLHDWGGALGFDWAYRHQQRVRAIAYMETFVAPLTLEDLPESFCPTLKAVRSSAGEALVLGENVFIEKMLPASRNGSCQPTRWQSTGDHSWRPATIAGRHCSGRAKCRCRASRPMSTIGLPPTPHG